MRPVLFLAHRGASRVRPENTLPAFVQALSTFQSVGKKWGRPVHHGFEFDILPVKDKSGRPEIVIFHDDDLQRTAHSPLGHPPHTPIASLNLEEIRRLDAGLWFSQEFAGTQVPLLREVLATCLPTTVMDIEVKRNTITDVSDGTELLLLDYLDAHDGNGPRLIHSFDAGFITRFRNLVNQRHPNRPYTYGVAFWAKDFAVREQWMPIVKPDYILLQQHPAMKDEIPRWQAQGAKVLIWTLNTIAEIAAAVDAGADAVLSDRPELLEDPQMPQHLAERFLA